MAIHFGGSIGFTVAAAKDSAYVFAALASRGLRLEGRHVPSALMDESNKSG